MDSVLILGSLTFPQVYLEMYRYYTYQYLHLKLLIPDTEQLDDSPH